MSFYVKIQSQSCGVVTAQCGTEAVSGRLSNTDNTTGAGRDCAWVNHFRFELTQAHDALGGVGSTLAPFAHELILFLPDYEPLITAAANVMNKHDEISLLTLNATRRLNDANESMTQTYTMKKGLLTQLRHQVYDQQDQSRLNHRGELMMGFKFQEIQLEDHVGQTSGLIQTNSSTQAA